MFAASIDLFQPSILNALRSRRIDPRAYKRSTLRLTCTQNQYRNTLKINRSSNMKRIRSWSPFEYPDELFLHSHLRSTLKIDHHLFASNRSQVILCSSLASLHPVGAYSKIFTQFSIAACRLRKVTLVGCNAISPLSHVSFSIRLFLAQFRRHLVLSMFCPVLFVTSPTRVQSAFSRCLTFSSHISRFCFPVRRRRARSARRGRSKSRLSALSDRSDLIYDTGTSSH